MKFVKGCTNTSCSMNKKKKTFKSNINFCPECGSKLVAVCKTKNCYQVLDDPETVYCALCRAKQDDQKDKLKEKIVIGAGGVMAAAGMVFLKDVDKLAKMMSKIKPK